MMRLLFFRGEALYPAMDKLVREQGLADLFLRDFQFQPFFGRLQLLQPCLGGFGQNTQLDGPEQILNFDGALV